MSDSSRQFGPGASVTFLYYFVSTSLITSFLTLKVLPITAKSGLPQQLGLILGVVVGAIATYFNRTATVTLSGQGNKAFMNQLEQVLNQLGYQPADGDDGDEVQVYERSALAKLLSGKVFVQIEGDQVTIASRAGQLRQLRRTLGR